MKKLDGVIEAVRYAPDGRIAMVRAYERRGPAWSDLVLLERAELVRRLGSGKRFALGRRIPRMGGTFETGAAVRLAGAKDGPLVLAGTAPADGRAPEDGGAPANGRDALDGAPLF